MTLYPPSECERADTCISEWHKGERLKSFIKHFAVHDPLNYGELALDCATCHAIRAIVESASEAKA